MSKLWLTADEFVSYAPCGGRSEFTTPPERLSTAQREAVVATCGGCPVRPECIKLNVQPVRSPKDGKLMPSNSVWVAGRWLPDTHTEASRKDLEVVRQVLVDSLSMELERRPDALK